MKRLLFWIVLAAALVRRVASVRPFETAPPPAPERRWTPLASIGAVVAGAALAVGGLGVAATGIVPIKASSGHWAITEWFLQFSKVRSIRTHSLGIDAPPLDDPALVLRGAGHYDLGCRPCHGGPDGGTPQLARFMLPSPPDLRSVAPTRRTRELFYVVKHGIKLTGMPAWTAQTRDDEVWAVVAFLSRLPRIDAVEYGRLTRGDSSEPFDLGTEGVRAPEIVGETCARCHGMDGAGRGAFPTLAGQRAEYLDRALRAYADRRRHSGVMGPIAAALTSDARAQAVDYYAGLPRASSAIAADARAARGEMLARQGDDARMIPACLECHGVDGPRRNPAYPILAGQYPDYLALQLRLLQNRQRGGSEYVHLMHSFVGRLTDRQIDDVAAYFGSLR